MFAAIIFILDFVGIFSCVIATIATILGNQSYDLKILLLIFVILVFNLFALKKVNKEANKNELILFNLIKTLSKKFKEENYEEMYKILKEFRKSSWYKNLEKDNNTYKSNYMIEYGPDEYKIDYLEK